MLSTFPLSSALRPLVPTLELCSCARALALPASTYTKSLYD